MAKQAIFRAAMTRLETDRMFGVDFVPRAAAGASKSTADDPPATTADKASRLLISAARSARCTDCGLSATRTTVVYGEGNPEARLVFVGDAPGADEDREARPFAGKAGKLLDKIIQAMGYGREKVYIANVLKCRVPENRDPSPQEISACMPKLLEQIEVIAPRVIVALGTHAMAALAGPGRGITPGRGVFLDLNGVKVMPTFHPDYLLRNESAKRQAWEDMKKVMSCLSEE